MEASEQPLFKARGTSAVYLEKPFMQVRGIDGLTANRTNILLQPMSSRYQGVYISVYIGKAVISAGSVYQMPKNPDH